VRRRPNVVIPQEKWVEAREQKHGILKVWWSRVRLHRTQPSMQKKSYDFSTKGHLRAKKKGVFFELRKIAAGTANHTRKRAEEGGKFPGYPGKTWTVPEEDRVDQQHCTYLRKEESRKGEMPTTVCLSQCSKSIDLKARGPKRKREDDK